MRYAFPTLILFLAICSSLAAQPPQGPGGRPPLAIMTALDTNRDRKLSADEIKNAAKALKKLDKNNDGKLSQEEIGWPPPRPERGGGFFGGLFPGGGAEAPRGRPGEQPGALPRRPSNEPSRPRATFTFSVEQLQPLDRNKDGNITKDEIPRSLQKRILGQVDKNADGLIDAKELRTLANKQNDKAPEK
jgi:hypothetical protein